MDKRGDRWDPEHGVKEGDKLLGKIVETGESRRGGVEGREYMVVKTRDGKLKEVWKTAALTEIFKKAEVGKLVAIKYLGERTGAKSGFRYYNYRAKISE